MVVRTPQTSSASKPSGISSSLKSLRRTPWSAMSESSSAKRGAAMSDHRFAESRVALQGVQGEVGQSSLSAGDGVRHAASCLVAPRGKARDVVCSRRLLGHSAPASCLELLSVPLPSPRIALSLVPALIYRQMIEGRPLTFSHGACFLSPQALKEPIDYR